MKGIREKIQLNKSLYFDSIFFFFLKLVLLRNITLSRDGRIFCCITFIVILHDICDAGLNMKVCVTVGILQMVIWAVWAGVTRHPSRLKLWVVVIGGGLAMLLEIYDFPPYRGLVDAHALWHATTIPLTYLWWSFIRDDAEYTTSLLLKKAK